MNEITIIIKKYTKKICNANNNNNKSCETQNLSLIYNFSLQNRNELQKYIQWTTCLYVTLPL